MLAIFHKAFANPPNELRSPSSKRCLLPEETLEKFVSAHPSNAFSVSFGNAAALAFVPPHRTSLLHQTQR